MRILALLSLTSMLTLTACEKLGISESADPSGQPTATSSAASADAHVHNVVCGCNLGKACGNMIEVDGQYVPLEGDLGLEKAAFCGKHGLQAKAEGELKDGKFIASSFAHIKK